MRKRFSLSLVSIASLVLVSAPALARADEEPPAYDRPTLVAAPEPQSRADLLRAPGTVVLDDVVGSSLAPLGFTVGWFTIQSQTAESPSGKSTTTLVGFAPSADVFVVEGLSVGGQIGVLRAIQTMHQSADPTTGAIAADARSTSTSRFVAPRVGYAFRLSDDLVLWPRVRVGFGSDDGETTTGAAPGLVGGVGGVPAAATSGSSWSFGADASLLFVLGRHAAIAAGPNATYAFRKIDEPRTVATSFDVGVRAALRLAF